MGLHETENINGETNRKMERVEGKFQLYMCLRFSDGLPVCLFPLFSFEFSGERR